MHSYSGSLEMAERFIRARNDDFLFWSCDL